MNVPTFFSCIPALCRLADERGIITCRLNEDNFHTERNKRNLPQIKSASWHRDLSLRRKIINVPDLFNVLALSSRCFRLHESQKLYNPRGLGLIKNLYVVKIMCRLKPTYSVDKLYLNLGIFIHLQMVCSDKVLYDHVSSLKVCLTMSLKKLHLRYGNHVVQIRFTS